MSLTYLIFADGPMPDEFTRQRCIRILLQESKRFNVPDYLITAHTVEPPRANEARKAVQRRMRKELGISRAQIARVFGRSVRRVRCSVIGG
jgi:hypothetical protein